MTYCSGIIEWEYTWEYENPVTQIDLCISILAYTHSHQPTYALKLGKNIDEI